MIEKRFVKIAGSLTRAPETKLLPSGDIVCVLNIAVNKKQKSDDELHLEVSLLQELIQDAPKYLKKGSIVHIRGYSQAKAGSADGAGRSSIDCFGEDGEPCSIVPTHLEFYSPSSSESSCFDSLN